MKRFLAVVAFSVAFLGAILIPAPSQAAAVGLWALGLDFGLAFPNSSSSTFAWGLGLTHRFSPSFAMELEYQHYGAGVNAQSSTAQVQTDDGHSFFGIKPAYTFIGGGGLWQAGLRLGRCWNSVTSTATDSTNSNSVTINDSHTNWFIGPSLSYELPVGAVTLGGEVNYIVGLGDLPPKALLLLATMKYWF